MNRIELLARNLYQDLIFSEILSLDEEYHNFCNVQNQFKRYMKWASFTEFVANRQEGISAYFSNTEINENYVPLEWREYVASMLCVQFGTHSPLNMDWDKLEYTISRFTGVDLKWLKEDQERRAQMIKELVEIAG